MPVLANITEFGKTPLYTREELGGAGVDIVLHCCSAYRAMNLAALKVYQAIRRDGTQKNVLADMQTRDDLYKYLDYHAYERNSMRCSTPEDGGTEGEAEMSATEPAAPAGFKPKKSVALSGVTAGNTALCTVGRSGNDLHYRGYDILEVAETCEFEEIAYLLIHGKLPNSRRARRLQGEARGLRGFRRRCARCSSSCRPATHPMDVLRTGASTLGCLLPEGEGHDAAGAREIADHLVASFGSMLCYWYHWSHNGQRIHVETDDDSVGGHFLHLLHRRPPSASWVRAMHTSLNLYAEHEFNSSTFTARVIAGTGSDIYSCITGAIGALRGPKHGGANEVALVIQERYANSRRGRGRHPPARGQQGDRHRLRSPGVHRRAIRATSSSSAWPRSWRARPAT